MPPRLRDQRLSRSEAAVTAVGRPRSSGLSAVLQHQVRAERPPHHPTMGQRALRGEVKGGIDIEALTRALRRRSPHCDPAATAVPRVLKRNTARSASAGRRNDALRMMCESMKPPAVGSGCSVISVATGSRSSRERQLTNQVQPVLGAQGDRLALRPARRVFDRISLSRHRGLRRHRRRPPVAGLPTSGVPVTTRVERLARQSPPRARRRCAASPADLLVAARAAVVLRRRRAADRFDDPGLARPLHQSTGCRVQATAAAFGTTSAARLLMV